MRIIAEMEILLEMEFFENAVLIDGLCNHMKPAINRMKTRCIYGKSIH